MFIFLKTSHTNVANYRCELISIVTVDPTVFQYLSYLLHMSRDHNKIAIGETQHYVAITKPVKNKNEDEIDVGQDDDNDDDDHNYHIYYYIYMLAPSSIFQL